MKTYGIHHISSMVGHPQRNIDFYASILALRLVKKTLNFDDKDHYHFYFGNQDGSTGLVTTFPYTESARGLAGSGQVATTILAIPMNTRGIWKKRLESFGVFAYEYTRFGQQRLAFQDPDGLETELVETENAPQNTWLYNGIDPESTISGIESATLYSKNPAATHALLTDILGYQEMSRDDEGILYTVDDALGGSLELNTKTAKRGIPGAGTVHHIAFKVNDDEIDGWYQKLVDAGFSPTEVKNRKYFRSLYFREKGGILIELATKGPGVLIDESLETLGEALLIPPHFDTPEFKDAITLPPVFVRPLNILADYGYRNQEEYDLLNQKREIREKIQEINRHATGRDLTPDEIATLDDLKRDYLALGKEPLNDKS